MKGDRTIFLSKDRRYRIVQNELSAPASWMTRRDLHDWVWTQPIGQINVMLGLSWTVGWHCLIYDIVTPTTGYFASLRAGNRRERVPLSPERDPNEPVPLVDFTSTGDGKYILRINPIFLATTQLGPPAPASQVYPRTEHCGLLAAPAVGVSNQLVRKSVDPMVGPPVPLTLGRLHQIILNLSDKEIAAFSGLYGLNDKEVAELFLRNEIAALGPACLNNGIYMSGRFGCLPTRKLSYDQKNQIVELSPEIRIALAEEWGIKRLAHERKQSEKLKSKHKASLRLRKRIDLAHSRIPSILEKACGGWGILSAAKSEGIPRSIFLTAFSIELGKIKEPELAEWKKNIIRSLKDGPY